ncbi:hypothetical protein [Virgisporangium aliadipatigenens]|nr:hypothetical protein [Virgisporangium aliadipatigenens]
MYAVAKVGADPESWQQVTAWYKTLELLNFHEEQLRMARDELAERWPPDKSPAAAAFVAYMDRLIDQLNKAEDDAATNHRALGLLLQSLAHLKTDMAALNAKYEEYEEEQANRNKNLVNYAEHSGGTTWREELNTRGRQRMAQADQEVFEASRQMTVPQPSPKLEASPAVNTFHQEGGADTTAPAAPQHNSSGFPTAVVPAPHEVDVSLGAQHPHLIATPDDPPADLAGGPETGAETPVTPMPSSGGGTPGNRISAPTPVPGWIPPAAGPTRINPPGGVIGSVRNPPATSHSSVPASGVPSGRAGGPHTSGARRVSPVGGVIGETRSPIGPATANGPVRTGNHAAQSPPRTTNPGGPTGTGVGRAQRRRHGPERPGDPEAYRLWPVAEGVPPVIESRPEPYHDPGPGVIGIDR